MIECVDTAGQIERILPRLDQMIGGGLVTLEQVRVIMYRPGTTRHPGPNAE